MLVIVILLMRRYVVVPLHHIRAGEEDGDHVVDDADGVEMMLMMGMKLMVMVIMMTFMLNMKVVVKTWLFLSIMSK